MEITLDKIELVKDRTGVSYAEAKRALEEKDGNVIDAIILIEESIDVTPKTKTESQVSQIIEKVKALVKKGNVSKILIKKDGETVLNLPVNVGILGVIVVPWVTVFTVVAALGTKCSIELVKDNGDVVSISDKANDTIGGVKSGYSVIADDIKEKGGEKISQVKEKASSVVSRVKKEAQEPDDDDYFNFDDFDDSIFDDEPEASGLGEDVKTGAEKIKDTLSEAKDSVEDNLERAKDAAKDKADTIREKAEDAAEKMEDKIEDAAENLKENFESADEKFEETIEGYKEKKNRFRFFS